MTLPPPPPAAPGSLRVKSTFLLLTYFLPTLLLASGFVALIPGPALLVPVSTFVLHLFKRLKLSPVLP